MQAIRLGLNNRDEVQNFLGAHNQYLSLNRDKIVVRYYMHSGAVHIVNVGDWVIKDQFENFYICETEHFRELFTPPNLAELEFDWPAYDH